MTANRVYAMSAITALTAQNTTGVTDIMEVSPKFFTEQRSWVRDRESTAVANSKKQSGSMLEELEYIRSLRDLTRERVYALAEQYESILDETE